MAVAGCSEGETELVSSPNIISPFQGEWNSVSINPPATLSLTSKGDSLFGTLRLSGREVDVEGAGTASSFVVRDDPNPTLSLHAVVLDHRTLKARLETEGSSVSLLLVRRLSQ
jgi:hypothetical protein